MALRDTKLTTPPIAVVIPNLNGADYLPKVIDSVLGQSYTNVLLIVVDNGSSDSSRQVIEKYQNEDTRIKAIWRDKNYGFTGGVNPGLELAIELGCEFAALLNNDAVADRCWLENLASFLAANNEYGIVGCKLLHDDGKTIDSTGESYTTWGLPYPRGRNEPTSNKYDSQTSIFGASGGASMYRVAMLRQIGLFDDDFFAYGEDVDISFRAQLAGWRVGYAPQSIVYHEQGGTSNRMPSDFTTYQTLKNYPWILWKNVPTRLLPVILPRFLLAYCMFIAAACGRRQFSAIIRGIGIFWLRLPKKLSERRAIQKQRKVSIEYLRSIMAWDLPPDALRLRALRDKWRKLFSRKTTS